MSTAQEIKMKSAEANARLANAANRVRVMLHDLAIFGSHFAIGREVCAKRARKLRRRGGDVRFFGFTKNGKACYTWMKRVAPWDVYLNLEKVDE